MQILATNTELSYEDEAEQLRASVDFLVELCDTVSPVTERLTEFFLCDLPHHCCTLFTHGVTL